MSITGRQVLRVMISASLGGVAALLTGCGGMQGLAPPNSLTSVSSPFLARTSVPQTDPLVQPSQRRQTIFVDDGSLNLFHGTGKDTQPYKTLTGGYAFELAVDASGIVYDPSESDPGFVSEYAIGHDQALRTITDGIYAVQGAAVATDGTLYVANNGPHHWRHGGTYNPYITVYAPGQVHPSRKIRNALCGPLAVDQKGRLFVEDEEFGFIDYYNKGSSQWHSANFQGYYMPDGMATDGSGNYFISSIGPSGNSVLQYGPDGPQGGPVTRTITSDAEPNQWYPSALAVDDHGNLYVADKANYGVAVFAPGATSPMAFIPYPGAVGVTHSF